MFSIDFGPAQPPPRCLDLIAVSLLLLLAAIPATADSGRARIDSLNALGDEQVFADIAGSVERFRDLADEARDLGYREGEARALRNLGIALSLRGRHDDGVEASLRAIRLFEELGLGEGLARGYGDLGYQLRRRDLPRALDYMRRGIAIAEAGGFRDALCALYDNYGVLQEMREDPDSAAIYYRRALDLKLALDDSLGIPFSLDNLAGIHAAREEFAAAESLLARSEAYRLRRDDAYGLLVNRVQRGDLARMQGHLADAARHYEASLAMPGAADQDGLRSYCDQQLATIHEGLGDFKRALMHHRRFVAYRDSLMGVETSTRIAALEIEFETERKDRELAEARLAVAARGRLAAILGAAAAVLAAVAVVVVRYQRLERREVELRAQLRLSDEKLRISRDLHDNIGARLTFLVSSLDNLRHGAGADHLPERLADLSGFGRVALDELRQTVWAMKHEGAGLPALEARLTELRRQCAGAGPAIEVSVEHGARPCVSLTSARMLAIYRVAQEAVQNAVKHAGAARLSISVRDHGNALELVVADDGTGFDVAAASAGQGLDNMRQRCEDVGGVFEIQSGGAGTTVCCRLLAE